MGKAEALGWEWREGGTQEGGKKLQGRGERVHLQSDFQCCSGRIGSASPGSLLSVCATACVFWGDKRSGPHTSSAQGGVKGLVQRGMAAVGPADPQVA